jgi:hypothetical protein
VFVYIVWFAAVGTPIDRFLFMGLALNQQELFGEFLDAFLLLPLPKKVFPRVPEGMHSPEE